MYLLTTDLNHIACLGVGELFSLEQLSDGNIVEIYRQPEVNPLDPAVLADYIVEFDFKDNSRMVYRSKETGIKIPVQWRLTAPLEHFTLDDRLFYDLFDESVMLDSDEADYPWFCSDGELGVALLQLRENEECLRIGYDPEGRYVAVGKQVKDLSKDAECNKIIDRLCLLAKAGYLEPWFIHFKPNSIVEPQFIIEEDTLLYANGDMVAHPDVLELNKNGWLVKELDYHTARHAEIGRIMSASVEELIEPSFTVAGEFSALHALRVRSCEANRLAAAMSLQSKGEDTKPQCLFEALAKRDALGKELYELERQLRWPKRS